MVGSFDPLREVEHIAIPASPDSLVVREEVLDLVGAKRPCEPIRPQGNLDVAGATPPARGFRNKREEPGEAHAPIIPHYAGIPADTSGG